MQNYFQFTHLSINFNNIAFTTENIKLLLQYIF